MIYPLPMRFPVPINGGPQHIDITITPEGWSFITIGDRQKYRRAFEAQVRLAKDTPTKGER
jgi:hypothetical protein